MRGGVNNKLTASDRASWAVKEVLLSSVDRTRLRHKTREYCAQCWLENALYVPSKRQIRVPVVSKRGSRTTTEKTKRINEHKDCLFKLCTHPDLYAVVTSTTTTIASLSCHHRRLQEPTKVNRGKMQKRKSKNENPKILEQRQTGYLQLRRSSKTWAVGLQLGL